MKAFAKDMEDAAFGCLAGALVGDAAGATLEFIGRKPSPDEVEKAITMPGGGFLKVARGQITDDGELTICLARALANSKSFDAEKIAKSYADWIRSNPFDVGNTTIQTLGCFLDDKWQEICTKEGYAAGMSQAAYFKCLESKANGSLMRATPLGIWGHGLKTNDLALIARVDSRLSHPNRSCRDAVACYSIAIAHLMNHQGDRKGAMEKVIEWADANAVAEVCHWLDDARDNVNVPYHPQSGFVKIAFTHAFRHLWLGTDYVEALTETLAGGGDTDTNGCIVGGLIGAVCGAEKVNNGMITAVLECDTNSGQHPRPDWLHPKQLPDLIKELLAKAPG
jgi:ADP-ribosyl-[dinitrogen reductase] hydrolase